MCSAIQRRSKMLDDTVAKLAVIDERNAFSRVYPPTTSDKCRSIGTQINDNTRLDPFSPCARCSQKDNSIETGILPVTITRVLYSLSYRPLVAFFSSSANSESNSMDIERRFIKMLFCKKKKKKDIASFHCKILKLLFQLSKRFKKKTLYTCNIAQSVNYSACRIATNGG